MDVHGAANKKNEAVPIQTKNIWIVSKHLFCISVLWLQVDDEITTLSHKQAQRESSSLDIGILYPANT